MYEPYNDNTRGLGYERGFYRINQSGYIEIGTNFRPEDRIIKQLIYRRLFLRGTHV